MDPLLGLCLLFFLGSFFICTVFSLGQREPAVILIGLVLLFALPLAGYIAWAGYEEYRWSGVLVLAPLFGAFAGYGFGRFISNSAVQDGTSE